jgi:putative FmdB family regulatory protein
MPIFEYQCESSHRTEVLQTAPTGAITCPECGKAAERVFSAPRLPADGKYSFNDGKAA